jgi:dTDP-4-amino-4,6-dideoxygalactose transaminase
MKIPFNKPWMTGKELEYIASAHGFGHLAGDGPYTKRCSQWLCEQTGARSALLTHSCTAALEMCALLLDLTDGDEVIMPSFTFVSTANAFALRGARPVFVDIDADTKNIDPALIEAAITPRTRAIVVVHYAGVACDMAPIMTVAERHGIVVIEDAAQGIQSAYRGRPLGSIGHFAALSFHETKNLISGEGGALLINDPDFIERAEIMREKGTNRSRFFRGQVDKYTWVDIGSSYLPSELIAAFLWAQLEQAQELTARRMALWQRYDQALRGAGLPIELPIVPDTCLHNAHMYYVLTNDLAARTQFISAMRERSIGCVFHYVPLHSSPGGLKFARTASPMPVTDRVSDTLVRLPMWAGLEPLQDEVIDAVVAHFR